MSRAVQVRSALPADRAAILGVVRDAFTTAERDGQEELDIVRAVWTLGHAAEDLDLVATIDEVVVGHVLGSWGTLAGRPVVGVAPLAVSPCSQRIGVGRALMEELIRRADGSGLPLLVLLGNPAYYERFGFEPSGLLNIFYRPAGLGSPHFQTRRLTAYIPEFRGEYTYSWELDDPADRRTYP